MANRKHYKTWPRKDIWR